MNDAFYLVLRRTALKEFFLLGKTQLTSPSIPTVVLGSKRKPFILYSVIVLYFTYNLHKSMVDDISGITYHQNRNFHSIFKRFSS